MSEDDKAAQAGDSHRPKIMVAVDDPDVAADVLSLLGHFALAREVAHDPERAADGLASDPAFELLITDARMLKAGAHRLLACLADLRGQGRPLRTTVISSYADMTLVQRAEQLGVSDLIHGPVAFGELGAAVTRARAFLGPVDIGGHTAAPLVPGIDQWSTRLGPLSAAAGDERTLMARLVAVRNVQHAYFDAELFGDPSWNMILDLAVAERTERMVSVTNLCLASGEPMSTALRRVDRLIERGYLSRRIDGTDRRRVLVSLTDDARGRLKRMLRDLGRLEFLSAQ